MPSSLCCTIIMELQYVELMPMYKKMCTAHISQKFSHWGGRRLTLSALTMACSYRLSPGLKNKKGETRLIQKRYHSFIASTANMYVLVTRTMLYSSVTLIVQRKKKRFEKKRHVSTFFRFNSMVGSCHRGLTRPCVIRKTKRNLYILVCPF